LIEIFDDGDFCAETAIHCAELQPDHAAADHDQLAGHFIQLQSACGRNDFFLIDLDAGQGHDIRSRGDDDIIGLIDFAIDIDLAFSRDLAVPFKARDFVFLEQKLNALGVGLDDFILKAHHLFEIELYSARLDTEISHVMRRVFVFLGSAQKSLRRDTAHIQACPAQRLALFHACHFHAELRRSNRAHIPAGPGADHDDIKFF
jgi:hypothetical protein